ncbi:hypothetical protein A3747_21415 [Sulfitobacter sp. HI0076]|jgi:transposase-like protein|nr:hypothetical protein A3722_16485 [Sulfitobacter sp. HI0027]KZX98070.1 hypothetical protein A3720_16910 [Sulfitobacter sp. HI0021]KZZ00559.1 hypothetical protein A3747_21415 [Sulfitobacter sp. HI0076]|tara:strand:+ start:176 stop:385 length:210 start_codon:yes stop_codon:yes gene_type:complete
MKNNTDIAALSLLANEAVFEEELDAFLGRCRYDRGTNKPMGYRHGHREHQLVGTFGAETVSVPRARAIR